MSPPVVAGGVALLLWLLSRKPKAAPSSPPAPVAAPPARKARPHLELSNGNDALVEVADEQNALGGNVTNGTYVGCVDAHGNALPDSACALVRSEWPDVQVPLTALVRMTEGRTL